MKWTDTLYIAETLVDTHEDIDPKTVRFTQLRDLVMALPEFDDDPERCGERILEAIQMAWLDELWYTYLIKKQLLSCFFNANYFEFLGK